MKYSKIILLITVISVSSCTKEKVTGSTASVTIINAVVGSNSLVTNFSNEYKLPDGYGYALQLPFGAWSPYNQFGFNSGEQSLRLYQYPDTTEHSVPLYNLIFSLQPQSIHTLFLIGTVSSPDTLFTTDNLTNHPISDSSMGVRFVNLSPGSGPFNVNVTPSNGTTTTEFNNIAYKNISNFKNFPVIATVDNYTFDITDASTGDVIASYTMSGISDGTGNNIYNPNMYRYKNFTLALIGDANSGQQILQINNY